MGGTPGATALFEGRGLCPVLFAAQLCDDEAHHGKDCKESVGRWLGDGGAV